MNSASSKTYNLFSLPQDALKILDDEDLIFEEVEREAEDLDKQGTSQAVSSQKSCGICKISFCTLEEQRTHFRSQEHLDKLRQSVLFEDEDDDESDSGDEEDKKGNNLRIAFKNKENTFSFFIYKCVLYPPAKLTKYDDGDVKSSALLKSLLQDTRQFWSFFLLSGGYFAGAVFDNKTGKAAVHKAIHKYTTRRKQGGNQKTKDQTKKIKSAGSSLRRENEKKLVEEIIALMKSWQSYIDMSSLIFISAAGFNRQTLMSANVFRADDRRLRTIPRPPKKPGFEAVQAAYSELSAVEMFTSIK